MWCLSHLDFALSSDFRTHKTTEYGDFILPLTNVLNHAQYDIAFIGFPVHNSPRIKQQLRWVRFNLLTDDKLIDQISGNAALDGVPVNI